MLLLLLACSSSPETTSPQGSQEGPRDTLIVVQQSDFSTLNPVVATSAADFNLIDNLNPRPLSSSFDCELEWSPGLYTGWEIAPDELAITLTLNPDASWSDGSPVTSADVVATYALLAEPLVASPRNIYTRFMLPDARPEVVDEQTVTFRFDHPYDRTTMLAHVGELALIEAKALESADPATLRGHAYSRKPMTTGPWRIASWKPNEALVLEPRPDWWGPAEQQPKLERVIFKVVPEYASRLIELENGSADLVEGLQVEDAERLARERPDLEIIRRGWRSTDYLAWNAFDPADYQARKKEHSEDLDWGTVEPHPIFGDAATRRALSRAIDVDKLIADLLTSKSTGEVYGKRAVSTLTPELCAYQPEIEPIPFDPTGAAAELEALGWVDSDGDGLREKDGQPLAFTLLTNSGNPRRAKAAVIIQANLAKVGAKVEIEKLEANTFFSRLRKKDYEAAISGWSAGLFVDLSSLWHSGERYEQNYTSYQNAEVDALIEQALSEPDPAKNQVIWKQALAKIYEDQPYTFLYWRDELVALDGRFQDAEVDFLAPYRNLHRWSVPPDKVKYR